MRSKRLEGKLERILEMAQGGILLHKREEAEIPEESTIDKGVGRMNNSEAFVDIGMLCFL